MKPRWKIRRYWSITEGGYRWVVVGHRRPAVMFTVWENALLYIDIQEAGA